MRKTRITAFLMTILLVMPYGVSGHAIDMAYMESEILSDLIAGESLDFVEMSEEEIKAFETTGKNVVLSKDNGLKLTVGDEKKPNNSTSNLGYGEFDIGLTHSIRDGEAVKFSFMPTTESNNVLVIVDFMGNGERLKVRTEVVGGKQVLVYHTGENGSSSARGISSFQISANKVYDVIAKKNAGKMDLYAKESTDDNYTLILSQQLVYVTTASACKLHITGNPGSTATFLGVTQFVDGSKNGVLGAAGAALHHFDFDTSYDGAANVDVASESGLDFGKTNRWDFNGNYIPDGGAMAVRFRINNSSFEAWVAGEEGRAILRVGAGGKVLLKTKSNPRNEIEIATISQNTWYTFLVKDDGAGWSVWMAEEDDGGYTKLISTSEKEEATTSATTNVTLSGTSGSYVDYFTIFGPVGTDVPKDEGMTLLHNADFARDTNILNDTQVSAKNYAEVKNGVLSLTEATEGDAVVHGKYTYDGAGIPAGGYAEYSVKGPSIIHKFFQGGQYMAVNTVAYGVDGLTPALKYPDTGNGWTATGNITHTPNVRWIYRVARSTDGSKYSVWRKAEGTDGWTKIFNNVTARSDSGEMNYSFDGVGEIDYVKIYTPVGEGIVLTDGKNTTIITEETTELRYKTEVRAIADSKKDGVLIVGLYDVKGMLQDAITGPVVANKEASLVVDVSQASKVRAFLWDDVENAKPLYEECILDCNKDDYFIDFNDGDDISDWTIDDGFTMHDGVMEFIGMSDEGSSIQKTLNPVDEYVFEMRVQCPEYGYNGFAIYLVTGNYYFSALVNPERNTDVRTSTALAQGGELVWAKDEWKTLKVETYDGGKRAVLSFDNVPYMDIELPVSKYNYNKIIVSGYQRTGGTKATNFLIDWMSFNPKTANEINVTMPENGIEYPEGSDIELSAEVASHLALPQVEYKLLGNTVAIGYAPDYKATLANVPAGNYDIVAEYNGYQSDVACFVVNKAINAELQVTESASGITITPDLSDSLDQVAWVEYYIDGTLSGTSNTAPFGITIGNVKEASHKIHGKFYSKDGVLVHTADTTYTPMVNDSTSYSNNITYQVSGSSGTAEVKVNNGHHSLGLKYEAGKVSYLTKDGVKEYFIPAEGDWEILTDAYIADVYRNGQLAFSYVMPKTEEVGKDVFEEGLTITDLTVTIPEHKINYFLQTNYAENGMETYEISNLPYDYNLDFIASKEDDFRFAVSDGDFHLDFEFENGKIWAQDVDNEGMHPKRKYQADVPNTDGDIYYRAEVAGGFMRLYADGKWITTVRMPRSSDPDALAIETESTLKYISLCSNEDLYLYSDNFDGSGEISSLDYWELKETTATVNETNGQFILEATEAVEGRAELNATLGYTTVETSLDLASCEGGAYVLFDVASNVTEMRAGYNKSTRQFEIVKKTRNGESKLTANAGYDVVMALLFGQPLKLRVELEQRRGGETVYLYANDKLVLTDSEGIKERGVVGLVFGGGTLKVDYFNYRGDGHPVISAKEWNTDLNTQYNLIEKEDEWVLLDWSTRLRSNDFGKSWTNETIPSRSLESCHTVRLQSGALLVANRVFGTDSNGFRTTTYRSGISYDDGETWKLLGTIATPAYGEATCNRLRQGLSGRVYFVMGRRGAHDDGWCRVYWSNDEGKTWNESEEIGFSTVGHIVEEAEVIEMPDGEVRLYFRNETGMLLYITSNDYGETWDLTPRKTSLLMPSTFFNIEQDPYEPNTFYAVYTYDNSNEHGRDQGPRCRLAVSVSYDGGNEWQFIGTLFEEQMELFYATQGNDVNTMMNININVAKDHLVVTLPYNSEAEISNRHWLLRVITLDKGRIKALAKPEKLHTRPATIEQGTPVIPDKMVRTIVVSNQNTNALIGGKVYKNISYDNSLPVEIVAGFLGTSVESQSESEVRLKQGDLVVKFNGNEVSSKNGRIYLSIDAVAEKFHLYTCQEEEVAIVSPYPKWSMEQIRTYRYALNLFADSNREYMNSNIDAKDTWEEYVKYLDSVS